MPYLNATNLHSTYSGPLFRTPYSIHTIIMVRFSPGILNWKVYIFLYSFSLFFLTPNHLINSPSPLLTHMPANSSSFFVCQFTGVYANMETYRKLVKPSFLLPFSCHTLWSSVGYISTCCQDYLYYSRHNIKLAWKHTHRERGESEVKVSIFPGYSYNHKM